MLSSHGEEAPKRWTKIELLQRVEEVTGVDYTRTTAQEKSEYRMYMSALNQAATRKNTLQAYCRKTLDMEVNPNLTIAQLQKEAVSVIYGKATPGRKSRRWRTERRRKRASGRQRRIWPIGQL